MTTSPSRKKALIAPLFFTLYIAMCGAMACGPEPIVGPPGSNEDRTPAPDPDANKDPFRPGGGNQIPWPDMDRFEPDQGTPAQDMSAELDMPSDLPDEDRDHSPDLATPEDQGMPTPPPDMPAMTNPLECEPWPITDLAGVSIADVASSYSPATWESALLTMMSRRYPEGYNLLQLGRSLGTSGDCILQYADFMDTSTLGRFALDLGITLRSCGYVFNSFDPGTRTHELYRYNAATSGIDIQSLSVPASWPTRGIVKSYLPPQLDQDTSVLNHLTRQSDLDAPMSAILDEMQLYTEELASGWALRDVLTTEIAVSRREPVRMHQLWVLIYLYDLRTTQPSAYTQLANDDALRAHVLWVWARAEFILSASAAVQSLGIGKEGPIQTMMADTRWSQEIASLRAAHGCR